MVLRLLVLGCCVALFGAPAQAQILRWQASAHPDGLQVNGVAASADGRFILSGTNCHPAKLSVFDAADGAVRWVYTPDDNLMCLMGVGFSSNGKYIASVEEMGHILLFDNTTVPPSIAATIDMETAYAFSLCFSPNSNAIAAGGSDGKLQVYSTSTGTRILTMQAHPWVTAVNYSPDSRMLASGGNDKLVKLWDTTGALLHTLSGHSKQVHALQFTPDSKHLISASADGAIKMWDAHTGEHVRTIVAAGAAVSSVHISLDGRYLVWTAASDSVSVWSMETNTVVARFLIAGAATPVCAAWLPNEPSVAIGTNDGKVLLYDISLATSVQTQAEQAPLRLVADALNKGLFMYHVPAGANALQVYSLSGAEIARTDRVEPTEILYLAMPVDAAAGVYVLHIQMHNGTVIAQPFIW